MFHCWWFLFPNNILFLLRFDDFFDELFLYPVRIALVKLYMTWILVSI